MANLRINTIALVVCQAFSSLAAAQIPMAGPPYIPGGFRPIQGSGAQYEFTLADGAKTSWAFAVVGKQRVHRQDAYWLEARAMEGTRLGPITTSLIVTQGKNQGTVRVITQEPGKLPIEIPVFPAKQMAKRGFDSGLRDDGLGDKVGTEAIATLVGIFECDHYHGKPEMGGGDIWVSATVTPYGLVKWTPAPGSASGIVSVVLDKVLTNERTQISFGWEFGAP